MKPMQCLNATNWDILEVIVKTRLIEWEIVLIAEVVVTKFRSASVLHPVLSVDNTVGKITTELAPDITEFRIMQIVCIMPVGGMAI